MTNPKPEWRQSIVALLDVAETDAYQAKKKETHNRYLAAIEAVCGYVVDVADTLEIDLPGTVTVDPNNDTMWTRPNHQRALVPYAEDLAIEVAASSTGRYSIEALWGQCPVCGLWTYLQELNIPGDFAKGVRAQDAGAVRPEHEDGDGLRCDGRKTYDPPAPPAPLVIENWIIGSAADRVLDLEAADYTVTITPHMLAAGAAVLIVARRPLRDPRDDLF
jgi:hypothetical protein